MDDDEKEEEEEGIYLLPVGLSSISDGEKGPRLQMTPCEYLSGTISLGRGCQNFNY